MGRRIRQVMREKAKRLETAAASPAPPPSSVPSNITMSTSSSPGANRTATQTIRLDEKILTFASSVHQICKEQMDEVNILSESLGVIKELMESLSEAVVRLGITRSDNDSDALETILKETKTIFALVTRLCHLQPLLLYAERSSILSQVAVAIANLQETLEVDWQALQGRLQATIEDAQKDKMRLVQDDEFLLQLTQPQLVSRPARKDLLRLLTRRKRHAFKESVHEHRAAAAKQAAQQDLQYMDALIRKVVLLLERLKLEASSNTLDAASLVSVSEQSLRSLNPAPLPAWAVCPVSKKIMLDPVTVRADCNHTLSKSVFQQWLEQDNKTCPVCGCKLKALYAKANQQLKWKVQEMENQRSSATLANPLVPASPPTTITPGPRRFSTGEFTSRRTLVGETTRSAAPKSPMTLRGEGFGKQAANPLMTPSEELSLASSEHSKNKNFDAMMQALSESQTLEWIGGAGPAGAVQDSPFQDSISTLGGVSLLGDDLWGASAHSYTTLASIGEENDNNNDVVHSTPQTHRPPAPPNRTISDQTQVAHNRSGTRKPPENNLHHNSRPTPPQQPAPLVPTNVSIHTDADMIGSSKVQFAPVLVTEVLEPTPEQEPTTTKVSNYLMVDRSKMGKKKTKNLAKKLFQKVVGKKNKNKTLSSSAVASAKVTLVRRNNKNNSISNSASTASTADASSGWHNRTAEPTTTNSPSLNSSVVSILKKNGKHSPPPSPTKQQQQGTRRRGSPPPLLPMKA